MLLDLVMLGADPRLARLVANGCVPRLVMRMLRTSIDDVSVVPRATPLSRMTKNSWISKPRRDQRHGATVGRENSRK